MAEEELATGLRRDVRRELRANRENDTLHVAVGNDPDVKFLFAPAGQSFPGARVTSWASIRPARIARLSFEQPGLGITVPVRGAIPRCPSEWRSTEED
jgi:hypothetical protein